MSGSVCKNCGCKASKVTNTWEYTITANGREYNVIKRRRVCNHCKLPRNSFETDAEDMEEIINPDNGAITPTSPPEKKPEAPDIGDTLPPNPYL